MSITDVKELIKAAEQAADMTVTIKNIEKYTIRNEDLSEKSTAKV